MSDIAETAESFIGKMTGQYDCSGFTQYVYSLHGKSIPHSSEEQFNQGIKSDGSAGDIVCWNGHVGICDGKGNVIHSYNSNHNIKKNSIAKVSDWDGKTVKGYVRF